MTAPDVGPTVSGPSRLRSAQVGCCLIAATAACLPYRGFFTTEGFLAPLVAATVGGVTVGVITSARRWRADATTVTVVVGYALVITAAVLPTTVARSGPWAAATQLFWGTVGGWALNLSTGLPAVPTGAVLLTPCLIQWLGGCTATLLTLRTRSAVAPVAPLLAIFVINLLFVAGRPGSYPATAAIMIVAVTSLVLLRADTAAARRATGGRPPEPHAGDPATRLEPGRDLRRLTYGFGTAVVVALVGTFGAIIGWPASGTDRFDIRTVHSLPVTAHLVVTPLSTVQSQVLTSPPVTQFVVRVLTTPSGAAGPNRIPLAVLSDFDGSTWTSDDHYDLADLNLPGGQDPLSPATFTTRITIDQLAGPFLPAFSGSTRIDTEDDRPVRLGFSRASGVLVTDSTSLHGLSYDLTAQLGPVEPPGPTDRPSAGRGFSAMIDVPPGMPPQVQALARQLSFGTAGPYATLMAIQNFLRDIPYDAQAVPGHSYAAIDRFLSPAVIADGGNTEQHVATFAAMSRFLGFPTRVVVGYQLRDPVNDTYTVTTRDAYAWPEVHFDRYGWVAFDPTDIELAPANPVPVPIPSPKSTPTPSPAPFPTVNPSPLPPPARPSLSARPTPGSLAGHRASTRGPSRLARLLEEWGLPLAFVIGLGSVVLPRRVRRWRRRRGGTAAHRTAGAWSEALERLRRHGVPASAAATVHEIAAQANARHHNRLPSIDQLATLVTTAAFGPRPATDADAALAWDLERTIRRQLGYLRRAADWLARRG